MRRSITKAMDLIAFDAAVLADLATHAAVAIESQRTRRQLTETRDRLVDDAASATPLIGKHPAIENVRQSAAKVAKTDLTVLVLGQERDRQGSPRATHSFRK